MRILNPLVGAVVMLGLAVTPSFADGKKGKPLQQSGDQNTRWHCPPGLAKKNPPCVPPGQARAKAGTYGYRVGDTLNVGNSIAIRDPWTYGLDAGPGWAYYQYDRQIYRVDLGTRRILAVLELIEAG